MAESKNEHEATIKAAIKAAESDGFRILASVPRDGGWVYEEISADEIALVDESEIEPFTAPQSGN